MIYIVPILLNYSIIYMSSKYDIYFKSGFILLLLGQKLLDSKKYDKKKEVAPQQKDEQDI